MFKTLFESKDARLARERVAIQMGRNAVKEYVGNREWLRAFVIIERTVIQERSANQFIC
jgi:hypothetical protein